MLPFSALWNNLVYEECYVQITTKKALRKFAEIVGYRSSEQGTYIEFLAKHGVHQGHYFSFSNFLYSLPTRHYAVPTKSGWRTYNFAEEIGNTFYVTDIDTKNRYVAVTLTLGK